MKIRFNRECYDDGSGNFYQLYDEQEKPIKTGFVRINKNHVDLDELLIMLLLLKRKELING